MSYTVYLKKGEEKRVLGGHSWVYANEVAKIEGKDKDGPLAEVRASDGRYIGKEVYIMNGDQDIYDYIMILE